MPGGYRKRYPEDYDGGLCLIVDPRRCGALFSSGFEVTGGADQTMLASVVTGLIADCPAHAGMEHLALIERTPTCRDRVALRKALINKGL